MAIFNLVSKIIIIVCFVWSIGVIIFAVIRRGIERKKARKETLEIKEDETNSESETLEKDK